MDLKHEVFTISKKKTRRKTENFVNFVQNFFYRN